MHISYRAWNKKDKVMKIVTGLDFHENGELFGIVVKEGEHYHMELAKEYVLMQCTGIKDDYGRWIYEGDILRLNSDDTWYGHVKYMDEYDCPAFNVESPSDYYYDSNVLSHEKCCGRVEVVGNIYENPIYDSYGGIIQEEHLL